MKLKDYPIYIAIGIVILIGFLGVYGIFSPGGFADFNFIDIGLATFSGVAQVMLDNKRLETWIVWALVNIVSIPYFLYGGFTLTAFQYIFFLANTVVAWFAWKKTMSKESV
jgi:nicotinamide mononucleotide transporter